MIELILNDTPIETDQPSGMMLADFLRYQQRLTGTKLACREGDCGACTVLIGELTDGQMRYQSATSCLMPLGNARGKHIVSIEGINQEKMTAVQQAILDHFGTQCGFCTPGFIMSLVGFCLDINASGHEQVIAAIDGNICRCTGYKSIERAAHAIADDLAHIKAAERHQWLAKNNYIPAYFLDIPQLLVTIIEKDQDADLVIKDHMMIAGGTDVSVQKPDRVFEASITHMKLQEQFKFIDLTDDIVTIGGTTSTEDLRSSPVMQKLLPNIKAYMKLVSSTPIRNMATVAGNIVNGSPIADLTMLFLGLDTTLVLSNGKTQREIPLKHFYKAYKDLDKADDEFIEKLYFNAPTKNQHFNFEKVSKRTHLDIASVNTAILIEVHDKKIESIHLSAGGVGPTPLYLQKTCTFLQGKIISAEIIREASLIIKSEIKPISDVRGTAEYKTLLLCQLFFAHFLKLFPKQIHAEEVLL